MPIDKVILVPGICGSVLKDGNDTIWPGTPWNVEFQSYPDAYVNVLAHSKTLQATDVLRSVPLDVFGVTVHHFDGYQSAITALENMGFHESNGSLVPWAYDWRIDIRDAAKALRDRLAQPDFAGRTVAIVAHSMGGLVSRYMLENLDAPIKIELCVLVAVPHLGAPACLQNILGLRPEIFLSAAQCQAALRNPDFPSAYQLLPRPGVPTLLEPSAATGFVIRDPYKDAALSVSMNLVAGSMKAQSDFSDALDHMAPGFTPPCRYVGIVGNAQSTTTANYLQGGSALQGVEEAAGGDGTVPLWSAAPAGIPIRYVSATHAGMFADDDTVAMLRAVLTPGKPGGRLLSIKPSGQPPVLSVQAIQQSVETDKDYTVALVTDIPATEIDAMLVVESNSKAGTKTTKVPVQYKGGKLRSVSVDLTAPPEPGVVRLSVEPNKAGIAGKAATVLVLRP